MRSITTIGRIRRRRKATVRSITQFTAAAALILLLSSSAAHHHIISAFPTLSSQSMIASRRITTAFLQRRNTQIRTVSIANNNNRRQQSSRLYNLRDLVEAPTAKIPQSTTSSEQNVVELQYSEFKPPSDKEESHPPVIFLHGLLGNKRNFASLASSLSTQLNQPRSIYTLDLRNHGENTHDWRDSMTYSEMARDVIAFMDKIPELTNGKTDGEGGLANGEGEGTINGTEKQKAVIVGHSMGGKVAQSLALMYPERVAGLVIIDIAPVRYYSDQARDKEGGGAWSAVEQIVRNVASIDLNEEQFTTKRDVDAVLRNGMLEDAALRAFVLTNLEQLRNEDVPLRWKIHWEGIVNELDSIAGFDVHDIVMDDSVNNEGEEERISSSSNVQYEGDVFFIHGGASRFVRHSYISTIASYFPNHMLTTIRGVGHWVHAEAPDDTIALLKRYLDR